MWRVWTAWLLIWGVAALSIGTLGHAVWTRRWIWVPLVILFPAFGPIFYWALYYTRRGERGLTRSEGM